MKKSFNCCLAFVVVALMATGCDTTPAKTGKPAADTTAMAGDTAAPVLDHLLVDNAKDPSCGMPISAGIGDTAHYKGKLFGFCSKECKNAFLKNPEASLAAAEVKKK